MTNNEKKNKKKDKTRKTIISIRVSESNRVSIKQVGKEKDNVDVFSFIHFAF